MTQDLAAPRQPDDELTNGMQGCLQRSVIVGPASATLSMLNYFYAIAVMIGTISMAGLLARH